MNVQIFTTGGTFDKVYYDALSEFQIGEPMASNLLAEAGVEVKLAPISLLKKDSLELTDADRELIAQNIQHSTAAHIVLIHGTDTMVQTAQRLQSITDKVIVLTGAMQPARMQHSDAPFNLGLAFGAAQYLPAGVYIAMNGQVFNVNQVIKNRAAGRFEATP